jgi:hypothetical protein
MSVVLQIEGSSYLLREHADLLLEPAAFIRQHSLSF